MCALCSRPFRARLACDTTTPFLSCPANEMEEEPFTSSLNICPRSLLQKRSNTFPSFYELIRGYFIFPVLRIRDVYPGSRIQIFPSQIPHPGSRIQGQRYSGSGLASKNLSILTLKTVSNFSQKNNLECSSRIPDPDFFPFPDPNPGVKKAPDPGSRNTAFLRTTLPLFSSYSVFTSCPFYSPE